ncbi:flagellar microtugule protofilament ribbon protein, putative [Ichthyophthirius multifiliis]|uniref:Flagellar microtugule protofilament ribbon protein, putative n=1 Tax=Ichthyophthirius multifiliis TaxID=5932 RepID=G0QIS4_ICHMU|nr:flagellar microtugule protofilament ribbon protein, putative [Ichthyophthirius multifiliis]EGR34903.1 flagellar microtugule protofilament ribbon protein, putative [Ichthyophthirius multifiliis]|eukprot:XP_004040207.1 flagellar microtugule protofilament ribbon protein, putative [Ichthyophthirius multifiliis]
MKLIDVQNIAAINRIENDKLYQVICFAVELGHSRKVLRLHRFCITVYTNRKSVNIFVIDVNKQITDLCEPGQKCVIIVDLDTDKKMCSDKTCVKVQQGSSYTVGDFMYVNIWLKDNSYTKYFDLVKVVFSDDSAVFDFTQITQVISQTYGNIILAIELTEPSIKATFQVTLNIRENANILRRLNGINAKENKVVQNFDVQIMSVKQNIPLLPGHCFNETQKEKHNKIQQFTLVNGVQCEKTNYISEQDDPNLLDSLKMGTPLSHTYGTKKQVINDYVPRIQPPWLKYDRQVLRFYSYFQESVVEDPKENYRIRKCVIYYYLSDGTIHVNEPKTENSGITQGVFIKRQKVPKQLGSNEYYTWEDLNLAQNINLFERVFRIIDCDSFTREYYAYMGSKMNQPERIPVDNFEAYKQIKDIKIPPPDAKEYKEYNDVKLGGGHPNTGLQKYLENDRKVLSFKLLWNDTSLEGGLNLFTLNFFLADDTVEIKEVRKSNNGKDPYNLFLNRKKLPKQPINTHYPGMTLKKEEYFTPSDLLCGQLIKIFSKDCLIYDCDPYTKEWYLHNLSIQQIPASLPKGEVRKTYQPVPPYNGYGTEEDSLGSVYYLVPKAPKKDINKMYTQDQYILRFESRLISQCKDDNQRKFIISFYCGDDTIMVYEDADKNSGIWGGKFLERMIHYNPITGKQYQEIDFQIGELVQLGGYKFQLLRADEYTVKYMKSKPEVFKESDIQQVVNRLRQFSQKFKSYEDFLIQFVKNIDQDAQGQVDFNQVVRGLQKLGFNLTYQEIYTLIRHYSIGDNFKLSMKDLFVGLGGKQNIETK